MRGLGEETSGQGGLENFGRPDPPEAVGVGVLHLPGDLEAGVGDDEGEAMDSDPSGELEADLELESATAAVSGDPGEDGDPHPASVLWLVSTFFSRSSVIFLPAMLCVSKMAVRFSTTAARKCAVPLTTPSLMVWTVWEILPRIRNLEPP